MFNTRLNIMNINSIQTFANVKGGINKNCKDVYFVRFIGYGTGFAEEIEKMDELLTKRQLSAQGKYLRIKELPKLSSMEDVKFYTNCYRAWKESGREKTELKIVKDSNINSVFSKSYENVLNKFIEVTSNANETINKNFIIKLMFWSDKIAKTIAEDWQEKASYKIVYHGILKKQEYLFLYFLTLLGVDVMILLPKGDEQFDHRLMELSTVSKLGDFGDIFIPDYVSEKYIKKQEEKKEEPVPVLIGNSTSESRPKVNAQHPGRSKENDNKVNISSSNANHQPSQQAKGNSSADRAEMKSEDLASLASSVVMISIHDNKGQVIGTGSGIMISEKGYILTNNHVARGGAYYSVRIEDDDAQYKTDEIIKYNQVFDLAVIRIDRRLNPLKIYNGKNKLVRGQKVVAIGSPLGLFNSVSDGIISGFREIEHVEMIQFTAPISHGSSGGAVLNMFGEVIGISTAGIDRGQNINLAVGYDYIKNFIRGFV